MWKIPYVHCAQTSLSIVQNIMQNCSRTFFYEIHVLLEKYAQLLVLQNEFELREGI